MKDFTQRKCNSHWRGVLYNIEGAGKSLADLAYSRIKSLPIKTIDRIDEELLLTAAGLKAKYHISYADSFAAALAMIRNCSLLIGDPEFKSLEEKGIIGIEWLM